MIHKYIIPLIVLLFFSSFAMTAQERGGSVKVKLTDSLTSEPVSYATIYVSRDGTPAGAYYAMTDGNGVGVISPVPAGRYVFIAELMGYKTLGRNIIVGNGVNDLGELFMNQNIEMLDAVVVSAVGNPIVVKKDTIEYSAAAYKTSDNDVLEDLLKKLQGVEVSSDGAISYQGETINKILIDGKEFFLDDPSLASKNIPAQIIQKVKIVDKKSDQAEFTGIDDGNEEKVIDLSIKPGMLEAWFGNVTAGGGHDLQTEEHDARYQASGMIGRFTENNQISFILNGNNTNNRGFNDMNSEMGGGMRGRGFGGNRGGIMTSWMAGVNANMNIGGDKDRELGGNYLYSGSIRDVEERSSRTTFLSDGSSLITDNSETSRFFSDGHRGGVELDYKFNDKTSLLFRPRFNYGRSRYDEASTYSTDNSQSGKVNDGTSESASDGISWRTRGRLLLRQKIGETKGRTLSLNVDYSLADNEYSGTNYSETNTYADNLLSGTEVVDQRYDQKDEDYSVSADLTYTEPLGRNFFLLGSYRFDWRQYQSEKMTYDNVSGALIEDYSSRMRNTFTSHRMQVSMMKQEEKYNLQIGVNAEPSTTRTVGQMGAARDTSYTVWNFAPSARFEYNFSDHEFLRMFYWGRTSEPTVNQLMPVPDNSDPLYVSLGNAALRPEFQHRLRMHYDYTDMKTFSTFALMGGFNYTKDDIINASWYDGSGVQYTAPVNSDKPVLGGDLMLMINSQIAKSGFSIMSFTRGAVTSSLSYTGNDTTATTLDEIMDDLIAGRTTTLSLTEDLSLVYRNDYVETRLGAKASYRKAWYEIASQARSDTWDNAVFAEVTATLPWGMEIATDARYNYYFGYEDGFGEPNLTWNAEISQQFLKKKMTLRFKVYDILNQSRNNYRNTTDNYIEDVYNNTLGQYFIISLVYRFGNFDKMMGGMRGRGPGGPPPHRR
ncbi:MAG TPA: TonB-dependent receptor [Candidatus Coprenecus stercoravium]|uniref:TonB-dependent receptor n=1 Tax=Candidatus Coprenecus stercoravium TaxID=2840735 RepID=A0A9D2GPA0_9BACT|nr:TonB-dependent receptor [Candidatus Coprenecus stercoravium]